VTVRTAPALRAAAAALALAAACRASPPVPAAAARLAAPPPAEDAGAARHPVGMAIRSLPGRPDHEWRGAPRRTLRTVIWYPAAAGAAEEELRIPPADPLFVAGRVARDAPLAPGPRLPLVVLSHGTGGSALQLAWLGTRLAARGYVAAAVDHPGNNAVDGYTPQGFALWWERARDLSAALDGILADATLGPRIDARRIGAAGFSLGGYTVLLLAGARTDRAAFERWCAAPERRAVCAGPPEFPDVAERFAAIARGDPAVQASLLRAGESFRDPRVGAVVAFAPALGMALAPADLGRIAVPVRIVIGSRDEVAPAAENAAPIARAIPGARLDVVEGAGHYTFLDVPTARARRELPALAVDAPGVERDAVHARAAAIAAELFDAALR
jgi:predicted dienelactone hydrolase